MGKSGIILATLLAVSVVGMAVPGIASAQTDVTLTVSVTTPDGTAVGGASLTATWDGGSTSATTASNGKAFVDVPEGADVAIGVSHPDFVRNAPYRVNDASERNAHVTVYDKASATIAVQDADGPVDDATVTVAKNGQTVVQRTTSDGEVSTGTIEAGTYHVTVRKPGYYASETDLEVVNETNTTMTIERGTVTLEVNVTDDYFEPPRPIPGATATIKDVGSIITQSDGKQRISVPVNSQLTLSVAKDGFQSVDRTVTVGESDVSIDVDIARTPALHAKVMNSQIVVDETVLVKVTDEYGDPVTDATVLVDGNESGSTAADGSATVTIDSAGEHAITVKNDGLTSQPVTVTGVVPAGSTTTATTTTTSTDTETSVPNVPGFTVQLVVVGLALVAVLFGIRSWQRD